MLHHAKEELRLYNDAVKESYLLPATNDEFELLARSAHISSLEADLIFADHEIAFEAIEDYQKKSTVLFNKFTDAVKKLFAKFKVVLLSTTKILDAKGKAYEKMYENAKDKIGKNGVFKTACGKYDSVAKLPILNQAGLNWLGGQCDKFIALNRTLNKGAAEYQSKIKNVPNINNKDDLPKLDAFNEEILAVVKTLYSNYKKDCPESMAVTIDETKPSITKLKDEEVAKLYSKYLFPAGDDTAVIDKTWLEAALAFIKKCINMSKTAITDAINALDKANVVCDDIRKVTKPLLERFTDPKDKKVAARSAAKLNKSFKSFGNVVKTTNQKMFSLFSMTRKVFSVFENSLKWYTGKGEKSEAKTEEKTENTENQQQQNANAGAGESFGMYDYDHESYFYEHLSEEEKFNERYCRKALMAIDEFVNLEFNDDLVRRYGHEGIGEKIMDFIRKIWDWICGLFGKSSSSSEAPKINYKKLKETYENTKAKIDANTIKTIKSNEKLNSLAIVLNVEFLKNINNYLSHVSKLKISTVEFTREQLNNQASAVSIIANFKSWVNDAEKYKEYLGEKGKPTFNAKTCQIEGDIPIGKKFNEEFIGEIVKKINENADAVQFLTAGKSKTYSFGGGATMKDINAKFGNGNKCNPVKISESNIDADTFAKLVEYVITSNEVHSAIFNSVNDLSAKMTSIASALKNIGGNMKNLESSKDDSKMIKILPLMKALIKGLAGVNNLDKNNLNRFRNFIRNVDNFVNETVLELGKQLTEENSKDKNEEGDNKNAENTENNTNSGGNENYHNASRITAKENTDMKFNSFFKLFGEEPVLVYPELGREDSLYLQELEADMAYADKVLSGDIHIGQEGFFKAIGNFFAKIWEAICNFFGRLFGGDGGSSSSSGSIGAKIEQSAKDTVKTAKMVQNEVSDVIKAINYIIEHPKRLYKKIGATIDVDGKEIILQNYIEKFIEKHKNIKFPDTDPFAKFIQLDAVLAGHVLTGTKIITAYADDPNSAYNICGKATDNDSWITDDKKVEEYLGVAAKSNTSCYFDSSTNKFSVETPLGKIMLDKLINPLMNDLKKDSHIFFTNRNRPCAPSNLINPKRHKSNIERLLAPTTLGKLLTPISGNVTNNDVTKIFKNFLELAKLVEAITKVLSNSSVVDEAAKVSQATTQLKKLRESAKVFGQSKIDLLESKGGAVSGKDAQKLKQRYGICRGLMQAVGVIYLKVTKCLYVSYWTNKIIMLRFVKQANAMFNDLKKLVDIVKKLNTELDQKYAEGAAKKAEQDQATAKKNQENFEREKTKQENERTKNIEERRKNTDALREKWNGEEDKNAGKESLLTKDNFFSLTTNSDTSSIRELESYTKLFIHNGYYPGTEGFYDSALRLLTGVSNIVYRTLTNAKIVYRAFRGLKRTEIHSYQDRYAATIFRVKKLSYPEVSKVMIPRPKGLSTTYLEVTNALIACLNTCDMVNRAKSFAHASKSVMEQITDGAAPTTIAGIMGNHDNEIRQITGLYEKASACLSDKGMGAIPFGKGFSSMDEYSSVQKLLDDNCKFEYDATKVYGYLEDCTANMDKVIQSVKSIKNGNIIIGKNDIANLSDTCLLMAKTFDVYGLCIQDFNRVEHNFVEATKTVVNHFKL